MRYESKWYNAERAAHSRALSKPMRSTAKPGAEADSKAIEYARWIIARDGLNLDVMAEAIRAENLAKYPPKIKRNGKRKIETPHEDAIPSYLTEYSTSVVWDRCEFGNRPRYVAFEFATAATVGYGRRNYPGRTYATIYRLELPHWDADTSSAFDMAEAA